MTYAYDGPYRGARLRPCVIEKPAPASYAPGGTYIHWADLPADSPSWVSRGGWVSRVFDDASGLPAKKLGDDLIPASSEHRKTDERRCPMCGGFWGVGTHGRCQ
jgi:hypothetical protein